MRTLVIIAIALGGCGRFGFDLGREGDGEIDVDVDVDVDPPDASTTTADASPTVVACEGFEAVAGLPNLYTYEPATLMWDDARLHCESIGGYLIVLDDAFERQKFAVDDLWVGLTDAAVQGTWMTVCGDVATFLPWGANEPDDVAGADCAKLDADSMKLADAQCDKHYAFVCECEPAD